MHAIIVGGGKVGFYILKKLTAVGHDITLIEKRNDLCARIAEEVEAVVLCGDGTDPVVLADADITNAEMVAAVTGSDEENLVICQIAKLKFGVRKTIARVNNPKNTPLFKQLGVNRTVCSTEVIAHLIEWEMEDHKLDIIHTIDTGGVILAEATIGRGNQWIGHGVGSIRIPEGCRIVTMIRDGEAVPEVENQVLLAQDRLLILTSMNLKERLEQSIFEVIHHGY